jgi:type IV secretion system protein VirB10
MVPESMAGSIFGAQGSGSAAAARSAAATYAEQYPYMSGSAAAAAAGLPAAYSGAPASRQSGAQSSAQTNREQFYGNTGGGSTLRGGYYIGEDTLWIGTIIPAVLVTGINTDLPGEVIARVTENIYDSHTGRHLLIPQGTVLAARYNSSVSYAQHRVQIVWDELIRPDGYMLELEGMNAVDKAGASGQEAEYHENWFEYLKAAGIITLFTLANTKVTEDAAKYSTTAAGNIAQANGQVVNQLGGNIIDRALDIKPTLTVESGTLINIMLNKNIYLPGVK